MRIVVQTKLSRNEVQEDSAFTLTAKFYDDAADPWTLSAPTTVRYRIDDVSGGAQIRDWTTVTTGTSVSIVITSTDNAIQQDYRTCERKQITIQANAGLTTQYVDTFHWVVNNVQGID
jgi:hypothetical protein